MDETSIRKDERARIRKRLEAERDGPGLDWTDVDQVQAMIDRVCPGRPPMDRPTPGGALELTDRENLAQALFTHWRKYACIYSSDSENATAWAASASDRQLWHVRAQEIADIFSALGWSAPARESTIHLEDKG